MLHERILILDFGSQVTQLIARRVRESNVYCEIIPYTTSLEQIAKLAPKGIILSGGPASVEGQNSPMISPAIFEMGIPILGICYGQQLMCKLLGGQVSAGDTREFGRAVVSVSKNCRLFDGVWAEGESHQVWMSHGDKVNNLPQGFSAVASSSGAFFAAVADETRKFYGVQFHPEVVHTPSGGALLKNFTHNVCGCHGDWTMSSFMEESIAKVRKQVGSKKVLCAVSGGVDSSVVAALLHKAIGDQLICIFVDTGMLRHNEAKQVEVMFTEHF